jgi:hypothetical protein
MRNNNQNGKSMLERIKGNTKIAGGFLAGLMLGILLGVIWGANESPKGSQAGSKQARQDELVAVRHTFSGHSQQKTRRFVLEAGRHTFIVWLLNWENGAKVELLTNIAGADSVSKAFGVEKKGRYILNVDAGKGEWEIAIE